MLIRSPSDDPTLDRTEAMLRRLQVCGSSEQAAFVVADELPGLVGADWAAFFAAEPECRRPATPEPDRRRAREQLRVLARRAADRGRRTSALGRDVDRASS